LLLLVEDLLGIYRSQLPEQPLTLTIAYSGKKESLELVCDTPGEAANPLDPSCLPDALGLNLIHGLAEQVDYHYLAGVNRVALRLAARHSSSATIAVAAPI